MTFRRISIEIRILYVHFGKCLSDVGKIAFSASVPTNLAVTKVASNAYGAPYAKNTHFRPGGSACFLLVEAPPQTPVNKNCSE